MMTAQPATLARLKREDGTALIIALMATMLLTALGMTLVLTSNTETMISGNYRSSQEALYAADASVERVVQDLLLIPRWNDILAGNSSYPVPSTPSCSGVTSLPVSATLSGFTDSSTTPTIPNTAQQINLLNATCSLQKATDILNLWGPNNPVWRLFSYGEMRDILANNAIDSSMYIAVWIADDPADNDGNPSSDTNGTLTLHAEAYGPSGTRKVIEVTVARTSSTEIERGQIAQRGQDELNQRARKAAVQTPGKGLSNMQMGVRPGGLVVQ
jgi:Tfp pilus assembly protein PilX